jgi:hypothetical protein
MLDQITLHAKWNDNAGTILKENFLEAVKKARKGRMKGLMYSHGCKELVDGDVIHLESGATKGWIYGRRLYDFLKALPKEIGELWVSFDGNNLTISYKLHGLTSKSRLKVVEDCPKFDYSKYTAVRVGFAGNFIQ